MQPQSFEASEEAVKDQFPFKVKMSAAGVRREGGLTATEIEQLPVTKDKE